MTARPPVYVETYETADVLNNKGTDDFDKVDEQRMRQLRGLGYID